MNSNNQDGEQDNTVEYESEKEVEVEKHANALPDIAGMRARYNIYFISIVIDI